MQYVTLALTPTCLGRVISTPWGLPDHRCVKWVWSADHQWRSPQCYPVRCLKRLEGDFEMLKQEILRREK